MNRKFLIPVLGMAALLCTGCQNPGPRFIVRVVDTYGNPVGNAAIAYWHQGLMIDGYYEIDSTAADGYIELPELARDRPGGIYREGFEKRIVEFAPNISCTLAQSRYVVRTIDLLPEDKPFFLNGRLVSVSSSGAYSCFTYVDGLHQVSTTQLVEGGGCSIVQKTDKYLWLRQGMVFVGFDVSDPERPQSTARFTLNNNNLAFVAASPTRFIMRDRSLRVCDVDEGNLLRPRSTIDVVYANPIVTLRGERVGLIENNKWIGYDLSDPQNPRNVGSLDIDPMGKIILFENLAYRFYSVYFDGRIRCIIYNIEDAGNPHALMDQPYCETRDVYLVADSLHIYGKGIFGPQWGGLYNTVTVFLERSGPNSDFSEKSLLSNVSITDAAGNYFIMNDSLFCWEPRNIISAIY